MSNYWGDCAEGGAEAGSGVMDGTGTCDAISLLMELMEQDDARWSTFNELA